jgi:hypothetical protein
MAQTDDAAKNAALELIRAFEVKWMSRSNNGKAAQIGKERRDNRHKPTNKNPKLEESPQCWDISAEELAKALRSRVKDYSSNQIDQGRTNLCGPAAFLYCLLQDNPEHYVKYALALWEDGEFDLKNGPKGRNFLVRPGMGTIRNMPRATRNFEITALDWMTLASLSKPDGTQADPDDDWSAICKPGKMEAFFKAVAAPPERSNFDQNQKVTILALHHFIHRDSKDFRDLVHLFYSQRCWIVLEINPAILAGQTFTSYGRHWVVLNRHKPIDRVSLVDVPEDARTNNSGNLVADNQGHIPYQGTHQDKGRYLSMKIVTWGSESWQLKPNTTLREFSRFYHGGAAFQHVPKPEKQTN